MENEKIEAITSKISVCENLKRSYTRVLDYLSISMIDVDVIKNILQQNLSWEHIEKIANFMANNEERVRKFMKYETLELNNNQKLQQLRFDKKKILYNRKLTKIYEKTIRELDIKLSVHENLRSSYSIIINEICDSKKEIDFIIQIYTKRLKFKYKLQENPTFTWEQIEESLATNIAIAEKYFENASRYKTLEGINNQKLEQLRSTKKRNTILLNLVGKM